MQFKKKIGGCLAYFGYFGEFWLFFLNSGGRDLPGEPVEIDFRPIFKKNEK